MNPESQSLKGSYRLHTATIPIKLTAQQITISLKNTYTLCLNTQPNTKHIKFTESKSANLDVCEQDKQIVELFQSVEDYECGGNSIRFYGTGHCFFMRGRKKGEQGEEDGLLGEWDVELVNLALEVTDRHFEFQGINNVRYLLSYSASKDGKISFELQSEEQTPEKEKTQKSAATVDFDVIFINCLLRARTFKFEEVSFQLFDENNRLIARGTPYLV